MLIELIKVLGSSALAFVLPSLFYVFCVSLAWSTYSGSKRGTLISWLCSDYTIFSILLIHIIISLFVMFKIDSDIFCICFMGGPLIWYLLARKCFPLTVKRGLGF
jgi:hypothetical protein